MSEWDLPGLLRRVRRRADMSQREIAAVCGVAPSVIAKAEARSRDLPAHLVARLAAVAGLRLTMLDETTGVEVLPMTDAAVRDAADRRFPAHLDTRHGDDDWWGSEHRPRTHQPRYTFDVDRGLRDRRRRAGSDGVTTPDPFTCSCLPGCDEVAHPDDDLEHADDCACRCDPD